MHIDLSLVVIKTTETIQLLRYNDLWRTSRFFVRCSACTDVSNSKSINPQCNITAWPMKNRYSLSKNQRKASKWNSASAIFNCIIFTFGWVISWRLDNTSLAVKRKNRLYCETFLWNLHFRFCIWLFHLKGSISFISPLFPRPQRIIGAFV